MEEIEKKIKRLTKLFLIIGAYLLLVEIFLTISNVAGRYFFRSPIKPTYELTGLFMLVLLSFGWAYTTLAGGHVRVEILAEKLPRPVQKTLEIIWLLVAMITFSALALGSFSAAIHFRDLGATTDLLRIPYYPLAMLMSLGACLVVLVVFFQLIFAVRRLFRRSV